MTDITGLSEQGSTFERYRQQRTRLMEILQQGAELPAAAQTIASLADRTGYTARDLMLDLSKAVSEDVFRVAIVGEYSSGKSSLLNLLLDMCHLHGKKTEGELPTAIVPTTAVITTIFYAESPTIEVILKDGTRFPASRAELGAFLSELEVRRRRYPWESDADRKEVMAERLREVRFGWNSTLLSHGVEVEDTPGLGSVHVDHGEITRREVAKVDAVIFTLSLDPPMGEREMTFLQYVAGFTDKFLFVQNKRDLGDNEEQGEPVWKRREREHRKRIAEVMQTGAFPFHHVSALQGAFGLRTGDTEEWETSGIPALQIALEEFLVNLRSAPRWDDWIRRTERVFNLVQLHLDNEETVLRNRIDAVEDQAPTSSDYSQWEAARQDLLAFGRQHIQTSAAEIDSKAQEIRRAVSSDALSALRGVNAERLLSDSDQGHRVERAIVRSVQTHLPHMLGAKVDHAVTLLYQGVEQTLGKQIPKSMRRFLTAADPKDAIKNLSVSLQRSRMVTTHTYTVKREGSNMLQKAWFWLRDQVGATVTETKTRVELNEDYVEAMAKDLAREAVDSLREWLKAQLSDFLSSAEDEIRRVSEAARQAQEAAAAAQKQTVAECEEQLKTLQASKSRLEAILCDLAGLKRAVQSS